jgi:hypothetical protein
MTCSGTALLYFTGAKFPDVAAGMDTRKTNFTRFG